MTASPLPRVGTVVERELYDHGPGHYRTVRGRVIGHGIVDHAAGYFHTGEELEELEPVALVSLHPGTPARFGSTIAAHPHSLRTSG